MPETILDLKPSLNAAIVTTATEALHSIQRVRPDLRDATLAFTWSDVQYDEDGDPLGADGIMHCGSIPAQKFVVVLLGFMRRDAGPYDLLLTCDPPKAVEGLGHGKMICADAVRMVLAAECLRMVGEDDSSTLAALLEAMGLTPDAVEAAARQLGGAVGFTSLAAMETRA